MTRPRVLVVRLDSDGDVLLAGPAIRAVAAGAAHVALLCSPRGRQAAALLPGVDTQGTYDGALLLMLASAIAGIVLGPIGGLAWSRLVRRPAAPEAGTP